MNRLLRFALCMFFLACSGCLAISGSFRGGGVSDKLPNRAAAHNQKYYINSIDFDVPMMPMGLSLFSERGEGFHPDFMSVLQMATEYKKDWIRRAVSEKYPDIFTFKASGVPVDVKIVSLADDDEWSDMAAYFCTLGIVPAHRNQCNKYEIFFSETREVRDVSSVAGKIETDFYYSPFGPSAWLREAGNDEYRIKRSFNSSMWVNPVGWWGTSGFGDPVERGGFNSKIKDSMREVFIETIAFDLAKVVLEWENCKMAKKSALLEKNKTTVVEKNKPAVKEKNGNGDEVSLESMLKDGLISQEEYNRLKANRK